MIPTSFIQSQRVDPLRSLFSTNTQSDRRTQQSRPSADEPDGTEPSLLGEQLQMLSFNAAELTSATASDTEAEGGMGSTFGSEEGDGFCRAKNLEGGSGMEVQRQQAPLLALVDRSVAGRTYRESVTEVESGSVSDQVPGPSGVGIDGGEGRGVTSERTSRDENIFTGMSRLGREGEGDYEVGSGVGVGVGVGVGRVGGGSTEAEWVGEEEASQAWNDGTRRTIPTNPGQVVVSLQDEVDRLEGERPSSADSRDQLPAQPQPPTRPSQSRTQSPVTLSSSTLSVVSQVQTAATTSSTPTSRREGTFAPSRISTSTAPSVGHRSSRHSLSGPISLLDGGTRTVAMDAQPLRHSADVDILPNTSPRPSEVVVEGERNESGTYVSVAQGPLARVAAAAALARGSGERGSRPRSFFGNLINRATAHSSSASISSGFPSYPNPRSRSGTNTHNRSPSEATNSDSNRPSSPQRPPNPHLPNPAGPTRAEGFPLPRSPLRPVATESQPQIEGTRSNPALQFLHSSAANGITLAGTIVPPPEGQTAKSPTSPKPSLSSMGLTLESVTPVLQHSRIGQPLCGAILDRKYLLIGTSNGLDFIPLRELSSSSSSGGSKGKQKSSEKELLRPFALVRKTRFKQIAILAERSNVLLAIAGRNDHVRVYALDGIRFFIDKKMREVEEKRGPFPYRSEPLSELASSSSSASSSASNRRNRAASNQWESSSSHLRQASISHQLPSTSTSTSSPPPPPYQRKPYPRPPNVSPRQSISSANSTSSTSASASYGGSQTWEVHPSLSRQRSRSIVTAVPTNPRPLAAPRDSPSAVHPPSATPPQGGSVPRSLRHAKSREFTARSSLPRKSQGSPPFVRKTRSFAPNSTGEGSAQGSLRSPTRDRFDFTGRQDGVSDDGWEEIEIPAGEENRGSNVNNSLPQVKIDGEDFKDDGERSSQPSGERRSADPSRDQEGEDAMQADAHLGSQSTDNGFVPPKTIQPPTPEDTQHTQSSAGAARRARSLSSSSSSRPRVSKLQPRPATASSPRDAANSGFGLSLMEAIREGPSPDVPTFPKSAPSSPMGARTQRFTPRPPTAQNVNTEREEDTQIRGLSLADIMREGPPPRPDPTRHSSLGNDKLAVDGSGSDNSNRIKRWSRSIFRSASSSPVMNRAPSLNALVPSETSLGQSPLLAPSRADEETAARRVTSPRLPEPVGDTPDIPRRAVSTPTPQPFPPQPPSSNQTSILPTPDQKQSRRPSLAPSSPEEGYSRPALAHRGQPTMGPMGGPPTLEYVKLARTRGSRMMRARETRKKTYLAVLCGDNSERIELFTGSKNISLCLNRTFVLPETPRSIELQMQGDELLDMYLIYDESIFALEPATVRVREVGISRNERRAARRERERLARERPASAAGRASPDQEGAQAADNLLDTMPAEREMGEGAGLQVNAVAPVGDAGDPSVVTDENRPSISAVDVGGARNEPGSVTSGNPPPPIPSPAGAESGTHPRDVLPPTLRKSNYPFSTFQQLAFVPPIPPSVLAPSYVIPPTYDSVIRTTPPSTSSDVPRPSVDRLKSAGSEGPTQLLSPISLLTNFGGWNSDPALFFVSRGKRLTGIVDADGRSVIKRPIPWCAQPLVETGELDPQEFADIFDRIETLIVKGRKTVLVGLGPSDIQLVNMGSSTMQDTDEPPFSPGVSIAPPLLEQRKVHRGSDANGPDVREVTFLAKLGSSIFWAEKVQNSVCVYSLNADA